MRPDFRSAELTVACLSWLRFGRQLPYIATKYAVWANRRADVFGADEKESVEIEVKISRRDLLRDFDVKDWKHQRYGEGGHWKTPNRVYFAVPERIREDALKVLAEHAPAYGLIVMPPLEDSGSWGAEIPWKLLRVAKSAKWLHKESPSKSVLADVQHRMASEVATFHIAALRWGGFLSHVKAEIERHHAARPLIASAIEDPQLEDLLPKEAGA